MIDQAAALPGEVIECAARVLGDSLGATVQVSGHEVLSASRSTVARLWLDGGPVAGAILKLAGEDRELLWNEYAGLAFLSGLPSPPASVPAFYGGDRELGFVLLEDYGAEHSLADVLLRSDAATARTAMIGYVDALLAVHLPTFGRREEFSRLRAEFPGSDGKWTHGIDKTWELLAGRLPELDAGLDAGPASPAKDWIASVLEGPAAQARAARRAGRADQAGGSYGVGRRRADPALPSVQLGAFS